jgi:hypothetical protein
MKVGTMEKTDFCFCVMVAIYGFSIFFVDGVRVGYNNSVGIKMGMFIQYGILGNKKMDRNNQQKNKFYIFPDECHKVILWGQS